MMDEKIKKARELRHAIPLESEEQQTVFAWAETMKYKYPELELLHHCPNGGFRNITEAVRFKKEGVKSGIPDIQLPVARGAYHSLAIELKRKNGGIVSPTQKWWLEKLREQGWQAGVCYGAAEAIEVIQDYLRGKKWDTTRSE